MGLIQLCKTRSVLMELQLYLNGCRQVNYLKAILTRREIAFTQRNGSAFSGAASICSPAVLIG